MSFSTAVRTVLGKYATFSGRARRSEYWWWSLICSIVVTALYILAIALVGVQAITDPEATSPGAGGVGGLLVVGLLFLFALGTLLPSLAVSVRRLHDTGRSGWWYLLVFVPFGSIAMLVFAVMDSTPGPNAYGPSPKGVGNVGSGGYGGQGYGGQGNGAPQQYGQDPRSSTLQG